MTAETVTPENTEAPAEKVLPAVETLGDMASIVVTRSQQVKSELDKVATRLDSVGDVGKLLSEALKESDNAEVKEFMRKVAKAHEAINEWTKAAEDIVKPTLSIPSDEEVKALDESYKGFISQLKTFDTVFTNEVKAAYPDLSLYDYVGDLPKGRRGSTGGAKAGQGEGTSRPRVSEVAVSTDNGESYNKVVNAAGKSTFSALSQWIKKDSDGKIDVGASDLHEPWLEQNGGVKDWTDLPTQTTFNYSAEGKSYFIRVTK